LEKGEIPKKGNLLILGCRSMGLEPRKVSRVGPCQNRRRGIFERGKKAR
jgi:hypothetical protein